MKNLTLFVILMFIAAGTYGQNLIGYSEMEIIKYMKENTDNQTLLFFLDIDLVCYSVRLICDNSIKDKKVKAFNSIYKTSGDKRWIDSHDGKNYLIEIKEERWSCVINIVPDK